MTRRLRHSILVGLIACAMPLAATAQVEYIDPAGGFTQVVTTTNAGVKTIFVSGQVGQGATLREHVESAFAGVVRRLEQAGATPADVVKIRIFVKDFQPEQYPVIAEVRLATFPEEHQWPASTMIGVRELFAESLRVEIEAIAVVAEPGVNLEIERFAPSNGFSGAVAVTAHGVKTVYVAGQVGAGENLADQTAAVWERVSQRLQAAGASLADLVKATTYIVDFDSETDLPAYRAGREAALVLDDMPASTLLGIPALVAEQYRIEIDGIAVVGVNGNAVEREFIDPATGFTQVVTSRGARAEGGPGLRTGGTAGRFAREPGRSGVRQPAAAPGGGRREPGGPAEDRHLHAGIHPGRLRGGRRGAQGPRLPGRDGAGGDAARHPVAVRERRAAGDRRHRGRRPLTGGPSASRHVLGINERPSPPHQLF